MAVVHAPVDRRSRITGMKHWETVDETFIGGKSRAHFRALADWWHIDTDAMSSDRHKFQHDAYQRIIDEIGTAAVPYMLEDLEQSGAHWYAALQQLTNEDFNTAARGDLKRARKAWLTWGKTNRLLLTSRT